MSIETIATTTQHPQKDDKVIGQMAAYALQIQALMQPLTSDYSHPTIHQIGESMRMISVLAHDLEFLAQGLTEQYDAAEADATAARLTSEQ